MEYGGREVEVYGVVHGRKVPRLLLSDVGERVGDYAFVDGQPVEWDGTRWVWSSWRGPGDS